MVVIMVPVIIMIVVIVSAVIPVVVIVMPVMAAVIIPPRRIVPAVPVGIIDYRPAFDNADILAVHAAPAYLFLPDNHGVRAVFIIARVCRICLHRRLGGQPGITSE
jgi:hypothetical protein